MGQGEIRDRQAWFGFTLSQLYWLLGMVPRRDSFYDQIWNAIKDLESSEDLTQT